MGPDGREGIRYDAATSRDRHPAQQYKNTMITLKAVAHPPDPLVPSLFPAGRHWIGWAGKSLSRQAIQRRLSADVRLYGPRGVLEVKVDIDLPSNRQLPRATLSDLQGGFPVVNLDRCMNEARDWLLKQAGLDVEERLGDLLTQRPKYALEKIFSAKKLAHLQCVLWTSVHEDVNTAFGAIRDTSKVMDIQPHRTPPFTLG